MFKSRYSEKVGAWQSETDIHSVLFTETVFETSRTPSNSYQFIYPIEMYCFCTLEFLGILLN